MLSLRRIRSQMYFGVIMLLIIVSVLSAASLQGVMKFRKLTKSIRERSMELPKAAELGQRVSELRSELWKLNPRENTNDFQSLLNMKRGTTYDLKFRLKAVEHALETVSYTHLTLPTILLV